jgi:hypothetical protein
MQHRLPLSLASFILIGLWATACGEDPAPSNRLPVLTGPFVQASDVTSGTEVALSLEATDADGDTLTYEWVQTPASPAGTFSNPTLPNPTWTAPQVSAATSFQLGVTVSDGRGSSAQAQVNVTVAPPSATNRAPTLSSSPTSSASSINGQQSVNLSVSASDPDGDTLTYSWSQSPSSPAGAFSNASAANPSWTAPAVTADTEFQLRVIVTDGKGGSVNGSVTVTVRAPVNRPPTVSQAAQANPASVTGSAPIQLSVSGTDPDSDPLTYAWTQSPPSPAGIFSNASAADTTWTSPSVSSTTPFTLRVNISDGRGGSVQSQVSVSVAPPIPQNNPPVVNTPTANPTTLNYPESTTLAVTYAWTQQPATPAGVFSSTTVANPTWTAPRLTTNTAFLLRVTVSDGRGGSNSGAAPVTVNAYPNASPTLTGPTASATTINEQEAITLSVTAADADGDPLTYAWAQTAPASPMGTFSSTTVANPTWTAPDVTATGTYTLRVTVSDGQGGSVQGSVTLTVQKVNQPPTVAASITGPNSLLAGSTGSFSITASDPDGDPLTYSWDQTAPATQGTWVGSRTASGASWYSPAVGTQTSFTLSVSVTDGQSTPVVRTLTFPVTVPNYSVNVREVWSLGGCTGCHGGSGGLDLSDPANLVDVTARAACNPAASARVVPNDPDNSVLIRKMEGTTCGGRMPQGNTGYFNNNPGLLIRVRSWILSGAPAN